MQDALQRVVDPVQARLLQPLVSRQRYPREMITADPRANGRPPRHDRYRELIQRGFNGWRFEIGGLVEQPLSLSLDEMRIVEPEHQITLHKCIQGWSYVAEWKGVPLTALLDRCRPTAEARYILFRTFDDKWEAPGHGEYYCVIDLTLARTPQTLLAYEMNGAPLTMEHGAPLRLVSTVKYGIKQVKRIGRIEFTDARPPDFWAEQGYDWYSGH